MKTLFHYATCDVWSTGSWSTCTCFAVPAWRIRKEPDEQFPWRIWRLTDDLHYEPLMRASSWDAAVQLVERMMWLRVNAVKRDVDV